MPQIKKTIILNALKDNAADFFVDADDNLQITGVTDLNGVPKASRSLVFRRNAEAEVLGVVPFTIGTATVGVVYKIAIEGSTAFGGGGVNPTVQYYSHEAVTGDTVTSIAVALKNQINANVLMSKVSADNSAGVLTVTALTGFPCISGYVVDANPLITVGTITQGVNAIGNGTALALDPNYVTNNTYGTFTAGATYTQLDVYWTVDNGEAAPSSTTTAQNLYSVFINNAATSSGLNTAAMNRAMILGNDYSYVGSIGGATITNGTIMKGTATALQEGQRLIISSPTTTTAAITVTTGAVALTNTFSITASVVGNVMTVTAVGSGTPAAGNYITGAGIPVGTTILSQLTGSAGSTGTYRLSNSFTFASGTITGNTFTAMDVRPNDVLYISVSGTTAFTTYGVTAIKDMTSSTAATGTCITAISAGVFKLFQYRNMPR